jgi:hypothetical protein
MRQPKMGGRDKLRLRDDRKIQHDKNSRHKSATLKSEKISLSHLTVSA